MLAKGLDEGWKVCHCVCFVHPAGGAAQAISALESSPELRVPSRGYLSQSSDRQISGLRPMSHAATRPVAYSSSHAVEIVDHPVPDIDRDPDFAPLFEKAREYTMTSKEVMFSLYQACRYVAERGIAGDFVECGVWRGGSSLLAALTFEMFERAARRRFFRPRPRRFWLYDTYEGMTVPTDVDVDHEGNTAHGYIERFSDDGRWCYEGVDAVRDTFARHGFGSNRVNLRKGDVLETLKSSVPDRISVLRLDTDWYESTKFELEVLYPRLVTGGVLIIDDYGHWEGSRQAVDEYFRGQPPLLLSRVTYAVRVAIKI